MTGLIEIYRRFPDKAAAIAHLEQVRWPDGAGRVGWAVTRANVNEHAAEHRNDVEVARQWVAKGRPLSELQAYGAYKSITDEEAQGAPAMLTASDASTSAGYR